MFVNFFYLHSCKKKNLMCETFHGLEKSFWSKAETINLHLKQITYSVLCSSVTNFNYTVQFCSNFSNCQND